MYWQEKQDKLIKEMEKKGYKYSEAIHYNAQSKKYYTYLKNQIMLDLDTQAYKYPSNFWLSFNQIKSLKLHLKKGSQGSFIMGVFYADEVNPSGENPEEATKKKRKVRGFYVFNLSCVEETAETTAEGKEVLKETLEVENAQD